MNDKVTSEEQRERLKTQEIKNNPTGNLSDSINKASNGSLVDLVGSIGWKATGVVIIFVLLVFLIFTIL